MSTTSTNKRPLLIDRPWSAKAYFTNRSIRSLVDVNLAGMDLLLDGTAANFDGALVDTAYAVNHGTLDAVIALFLAYNGSRQSFTADTVVPVAWDIVPKAAADAQPERKTLELPEICVPVPSVATAVAPAPGAAKNRGLWVPRGVQLFGAWINPAGTTWAYGTHLVCLGGLY